MTQVMDQPEGLRVISARTPGLAEEMAEHAPRLRLTGSFEGATRAAVEFVRNAAAGSVEPFLRGAATTIGRSIDLDVGDIGSFLADNGMPGGALHEELQSVFALLELGSALGLERVPVIASAATEMGPLFDYTDEGALRLLREPPPGLNAPGFRDWLERVAEENARLRLVDWEQARRGAMSLFGAVLEQSIGSFFAARIAGVPPGTTIFTLETLNDQLIVDRFFQSRYAPVQFGRSKVISGQLAAGVYCFQTHSAGSPPPEIDPGVHAVGSGGPQKGYTTSF